MYIGYKWLDKQTSRFYISRDVVDESRFLYPTLIIHSTPPTTTHGVSYPQSEPSIVNVHMSR